MTNTSSKNLFKFKINDFYSSSDFELNKLFDLYGSDKGTADQSTKKSYKWNSHTYGAYYSKLFDHCKNNIIRIFECGLGTNNTAIPSNMGAKGKPGASLRAWRDYFQNANIYGGDIDKNILFNELRIKTFYVDQTNPLTIKNMWKKINLKNFDLIIDDGLHTFNASINFFEISINYLSNNGIYIIEDVQTSEFKDFTEYFYMQKDVFNVNFLILENPSSPKTNNNLIEIRKININ